MNYIYPDNLKAKPTMWLWSLKHFVILVVMTLLAVMCLILIHKVFPLAGVLAYAFLTISVEEETILDFLKHAVRYFLTTQQEYEWR